MGDVVAAFMEDANILWGELVGGLLIVGCSIALVISLWQSLKTVPYSSFLLFSAITAALFAAGKYTLHHWKLETTSRGLLVIALLLTPLNLLILGNPSAAGTPDGEEVGVGQEGVALGVVDVDVEAFHAPVLGLGGVLGVGEALDELLAEGEVVGVVVGQLDQLVDELGVLLAEVDAGQRGNPLRVLRVVLVADLVEPLGLVELASQPIEVA